MPFNYEQGESEVVKRYHSQQQILYTHIGSSAAKYIRLVQYGSLKVDF